MFSHFFSGSLYSFWICIFLTTLIELLEESREKTHLWLYWQSSSLVFWYRMKCYASFLTKHIMIVELWLSDPPSMKCVWHNFSSPSKVCNLDKPHVLDGYISKRMQCHHSCLCRHVMRGNLCVDDSRTKTYIGKFFSHHLWISWLTSWQLCLHLAS